MQRVPTARPCRTAAVAILGFLAMWGMSSPARAEGSTLEAAEKNLRGIGANLQNSRMRMSRGFVGAEGEADQGGTLTTQCCRDNIERIVKKIHGLESQIKELRDHYQDDQDYTALDVIDEMEARLKQIKQGMMYFVRAETKGQAFEVVTGLIRPLNECRNAVSILQKCCPLPVTATGATDAGDGDSTPSVDEGEAGGSGSSEKHSSEKKKGS